MTIGGAQGSRTPRSPWTARWPQSCLLPCSTCPAGSHLHPAGSHAGTGRDTVSFTPATPRQRPGGAGSHSVTERLGPAVPRVWEGPVPVPWTYARDAGTEGRRRPDRDTPRPRPWHAGLLLLSRPPYFFLAASQRGQLGNHSTHRLKYVIVRFNVCTSDKTYTSCDTRFNHLKGFIVLYC